MLPDNLEEWLSDESVKEIGGNSLTNSPALVQASGTPPSKFTDHRKTPSSFLMWQSTKARIMEIIPGFLLVAALIGFAILCWVGVGYVCGALFSTAPA
jgi:hypothetical protein